MNRKHISLLSCLFVVLMAPSIAESASAAEFDKYAIESASASLSSAQAGAHADFTTGFSLTQKGGEPYALTRDVTVKVPPGLTGNPQAIEKCSSLQFGIEPKLSECPIDSQVGVAEVTLAGEFSGTFIEPIYNLDRPADDEVVARLGFFALLYPVTIDIVVDPVDYGLVAKVQGSAAAANVLSVSTTLWGVPAAKMHDPLRLTPKEVEEGTGPAGGHEATRPPAPFMTNPTSCGPLDEVSITATSYQLPGSPSTKRTALPQIVGCEQVKFFPSFSLVPTNPEAATPTGLDAELQMTQDETPQGRGTSPLRSATVTLPPGFTINPAAGDGLEACSTAQVHLEEASAAACPAASRLGSAEITVPALERPIRGAIYQRTPEPGRLFGFWLVADELGVHLKLPASIDANPLTGQLTTHFNGVPSLGGNPQVPVSDLKLHFAGGPRAPISTPGSCGGYQTHFEFTPWSGGAPATGDTPASISSGCDKGGFNPRVSAETLDNSGGKFSPLVFELTRRDGEANPQALMVTLPQGVLAKLAGVALCPEADAASATCPAASQVGTVVTAAGVGGAPLWLPQPGKAGTAVYLAGPYKGAPYSLVVKVPAQAGPFDLGTVVNRAAIEVDPQTAAVTVASDPLPQILEGVPISYRTIRVVTDHPDFTLNPTNCDVEHLKALVIAADGSRATPRAPFQAKNCTKLAYRPKLTMRLKGGTKRTQNPALTATLTQRAGEANTASATVILPRSEFIDQSHINNPCTRVQFNVGVCPAKSILGHAIAITPLLDKPLKGPIYFRSNGGERELPDLVVDLHGPLHVTLVGFIDSIQKKGTEISRVRTRFANVPDAPVRRFTLKLFGGKRGLIENSENLCGSAKRVAVRLTGQNGKRRNSSTLLKARCH